MDGPAHGVSMSNHKRVSAGVPAGGQFAATAHNESTTALATDSWVSLDNPDAPDDMPIYEGPAGQAGSQLIPGIYSGTDGDDFPVDVRVGEPSELCQGLDQHTTLDELDARLESARASEDIEAVQVLSAHAVAISVRAQNPEVAYVDLEHDGDGLVPVGVRTRFGERITTVSPDSKPWQRPVDLNVAAGYSTALRPSHAATRTRLDRTPGYAQASLTMDLDPILGTAPF